MKHGETEDAFMKFAPETSESDAAFTKLTKKRKDDYTIESAGGSSSGTPSRTVQPEGSDRRAKKLSKRTQQGGRTTIFTLEKKLNHIVQLIQMKRSTTIKTNAGTMDMKQATLTHQRHAQVQILNIERILHAATLWGGHKTISLHGVLRIR